MGDGAAPNSNVWYLLYTAPRAEKKTNLELLKKGFTTYLPLHKTLRQWSDRKKWIEEPLFKSYIFVKSNLSKYYDILNVPGIVKFVSFEKKPIVVREQEIAFIQMVLSNFPDLEAVNGRFESGMNVEIIAGPLRGLTGQIIEYKGKRTVSIELATVGHSLLVQLPESKIKPIAL